MDIEGGEYPWLLSIDEVKLNKFKQIVIEFHGITSNGWGCHINNKFECLEKLSKTHYLVHAHGNNHASTKNNIPDVIELTYINKNLFYEKLLFNSNELPIERLDYPNCNRYDDLNLNFYPFVSGDFINK
jgi:hypothetical protein